MEHRNFFISYTATDEKWAEWVGFALEDEGYTVFLQAWDISPGHNFVLKMDEAASQCDRTLLIMSRSYLASAYARPEWAQSFAADPMSERRLIIPVRIESCNYTGILKPIVGIDLVDCDEDEALNRLLSGISSEERSMRPLLRPAFPGGERAYEILTQPSYPPAEKTFDRRRLPKDEPSSLSIRQGEHFLDDLPGFLSKNSELRSIAFVDIDGQGAINRKFGRHIGDRVIEQVFKILRQESFYPHTVHRCGDDTFFLLLAQTHDVALIEAQRIVDLVSAFPWGFNLIENLWVTCSAAVATFEDQATRNTENIHEAVLRAAVGCRSARILGGNRALEGPLELTPDNKLLKESLSKRIKNIHSGDGIDEI